MKGKDAILRFVVVEMLIVFAHYVRSQEILHFSSSVHPRVCSEVLSLEPPGVAMRHEWCTIRCAIVFSAGTITSSVELTHAQWWNVMFSSIADVMVIDSELIFYTTLTCV